MQVSLPVLFEDNHLLVINKPAGLATMGTEAGQASVVTLAADYIRHKYRKPGNVFVGVVSRLDSMVSGVLVLARTSKAASRLSEQFREHTTAKHYLAWIEGKWQATEALELTDWMLKDEARHRMITVPSSRSGAQAATLRLALIKSRSQQSLVAIELITGRKHQIRVQLSSRGHPIVGDRKYDAQSTFPKGIALHSRKLVLKHPTRDEQLTFEAPVPEYWPEASLINESFFAG